MPSQVHCSWQLSQCDMVQLTVSLVRREQAGQWPHALCPIGQMAIYISRSLQLPYDLQASPRDLTDQGPLTCNANPFEPSLPPGKLLAAAAYGHCQLSSPCHSPGLAAHQAASSTVAVALVAALYTMSISKGTLKRDVNPLSFYLCVHQYIWQTRDYCVLVTQTTS